MFYCVYIIVFTVAHIVSRADTEDLMLFYNLPAFSKDDTNAFLSCIARSNGLVKKVRVCSASFGLMESHTSIPNRLERLIWQEQLE